MVVHGIANERFTLSNSCLARENHHTYIHRSCIPTDWLKSMLPLTERLFEQGSSKPLSFFTMFFS